MMEFLERKLYESFNRRIIVGNFEFRNVSLEWNLEQFSMASEDLMEKILNAL